MRATVYITAVWYGNYASETKSFAKWQVNSLRPLKPHATCNAIDAAKQRRFRCAKHRRKTSREQAAKRARAHIRHRVIAHYLARVYHLRQSFGL
jgi:hypothetical protein